MSGNHPSNNLDSPMVSRNKLELEPGRHYTGTFWLNEYGEFQCRPTQKGSRPFGGSYNLVYEDGDDNFTICESKNYWKLMLKLPKQRLTIRRVMAIFESAEQALSKYVKSSL